MKWSRERDYHGYKSYAEDAGNTGSGILAGLIGALKSVLGVIAKPTPSPSVNLSKGGRGYSTLGARSGLQGAAEPANTQLNDNAQCTR
jgi:hypothetical protein